MRWFGWFRRKEEEPRYYVIETPYSTMWNVSEELLIQHAIMRIQYPPNYEEKIRPMTEEEIRAH